MAFVTLPRGDVTGVQLERLADLVETRADGQLRTAVDQNLLIRFIRSEDLAAVHAALVAMGLGAGEAGRLLDPTSCPGAESCKIAVTGSRELALALKTSLRDAAGNGGRDLVAAAADLRIKISGCPNSCGQHHVAGIGFHGAAKHAGGQAVPAYQMFLGGSVDGEGAHFGRRSVKIPARRVPEALTRLLELFRDESRAGETAPAFFKRVDLARVDAALADLTTFAPGDLAVDDYRDLGSDVPFRVEMGEGECAS
jgi:sulfite reductase beta subunit-like hemoprotein